ncbi:putative hscarg dehydrogenase [Aspergillus violaceofuscus CBS 115571]|uniref:Putative hscarg dehydrogenase n=1 Tax=Aspergillus violaceofuscus (strain CBS 115571) TaxID=1450538 RepID=A0A2V5HCJ3_ASPV1|nr:putative hscarg dehydrogenase [Aspergillus violaceofuscus CBS 115571]
MPSDNRNVFVVFGATGVQGGSVSKAILSDPDASRQFKVRAITRDPSKPAALALAQQGAEVVKASLDKKEEVYAALQGAYAVYLVTNMEAFDYAAETRQAKLVAEVAKELDIKHLIWSSLPHISQITDGKLTGAVHWDGKAVVDDYIRSLAIPHTIINIGVYTPFIVDFFLAPLSTDPPAFSLPLPEPANINTVLPVVDAAADVGKFVKGILLRPEETIGKRLDIAEGYYTVKEIETLNKLGRSVVFQTLPKETFKTALASRGLPEFFQEDLCQVLQYIEEYGYFHNGTVEKAREIASEPLISLEEAFRSKLEFVSLGDK